MENSVVPLWVMSTIYWLHLLATVIWLGGLATLMIIILPLMKHFSDQPARRTFLRSMVRRIQQIGWLSLAVLTVTGLFQMSGNPNYEGFLAIRNTWSIAIFAKHGVIATMVGIGMYLAMVITPQVRRELLKLQAGKGSEGAVQRLEKREEQLLYANLLISIIVLALTALARAAAG